MSIRPFIRIVLGTTLLFTSMHACTESVGPVPLPDGAREFTPEPVFREWWQEVEACSRLRRSFDSVRWYVVPGEEPFPVKGISYPVVGYWDPRENRIVVLQYVPTQRAPLIRHEALHAILRRTDPPPLYFGDLCAATIGAPDSHNYDALPPHDPQPR